MAKAREYTMPQTERESRPGAWEGTGYKQFDQSSNLKDQLKLLESDRVRVQKELDELKIKRQNFDLLSVNVPEQTDEDKENIQAGQFRAGAEAMMEYDPATAQSWLLRADEIEARKQYRAQQLEQKNAIFTPGTKEWVNWMAGMLKQKTYEAGLYTGQARTDLLKEADNIKKSMGNYPLGQSALGIITTTDNAPVYSPPQKTGGDKIKTANDWRVDILSVTKDTPNWKSVLEQYRTDIATAKTNKNIGEAEAVDLNSKIDDQLKSIQYKIQAPALSLAKDKAEAKSWVKTFLETMRLNELITQARAARSALNSIISEVKSGHYANANLKPFKETMGAMSAGEYGIATDSPAAAMAATIPIVGEGIATWMASDKFNDEATAYERTNAAIDSFNQLIDTYIGKNLIPASNSTPERINALNDSPIVAGLRNALGSKINKLSKGDNKSANGGVIVPSGIAVKKGTIRKSGGKQYRAKRDLTTAEANKSSNYEEVK